MFLIRLKQTFSVAEDRIQPTGQEDWEFFIYDSHPSRPVKHA